MALDSSAGAIAVHRFGLGPKPTTLASIRSDPRGALLAELAAGPSTKIDASLPSTAEAGRKTELLHLERKRLKQQRSATAAENAAPEPDGTAQQKVAGAPQTDPNAESPKELLGDEASARFEAAMEADIGFNERLVWFWSNHFCVSTTKAAVRKFAGPFEREAIRPHVLGRFADMLQAVESHPAMLIYLDNQGSIGPNSQVGIARGRGLNENLGREIMELHTLGVRSDYTQADVTSFAKVITGWALTPRGDEGGTAFAFDPRRHEPGPQTVQGKIYPDTGVEQGRAVLADFARNPATAHHVCGKFARHFLSDQASDSLVDQLARTFLDSDGDLKTVAMALVSHPSALSMPRTKLKLPMEWLVGIWRAAEMKPGPRDYGGRLTLLGQPLWRPPAPKGFPDDSASWMDNLTTRLDIATGYAGEFDSRIDARALLQATIGPLASQSTTEAIARAENPAQALTLFFMSPEFSRR